MFNAFGEEDTKKVVYYRRDKDGMLCKLDELEREVISFDWGVIGDVEE